MLCVGISILLSSIVVAGPRPLTNQQLDQVYAAGFDVRVDLDLDLAATNPDAVIVQSGDKAALMRIVDSGITIAHSSGTRNSSSFDPSGAYVPDLQNITSLTTNNINVSGLQNATTLMNLFALDGDIAVGLNLNVIVNPVNSVWTTYQNNVNWGTLNLSDAFQSLD